MKSLLSWIIIFLFCLFASLSSAEVHKWVDEKGSTWITDYKPHKAAKKHAHSRTRTEGEGSAASAGPEVQQAGQQNDDGKLFPLAEDIVRKIPGFPQGEGMPSVQGQMFAMISGIVIIGALAGYIYFSLCLYFIAKKTYVPNPWLAWIPLVNMWTFVAAAGKEGWWLAIIVGSFALTIVPMAGIIFYLAGVGVIIYLWICITENIGRNKWLGLLMMVPLVNLIFPAILAFSKADSHSYPSDMTADQN